VFKLLLESNSVALLFITQQTTWGDGKSIQQLFKVMKSEFTFFCFVFSMFNKYNKK